MKSDNYYHLPAHNLGRPYMIKILERDAGRKAFEERHKVQNMRVTVYHTGHVTAATYFDVEAIVFDRQNNVRLTFFTGETKNLTPSDYTDIDCKKGVTTWKE